MTTVTIGVFLWAVLSTCLYLWLEMLLGPYVKRAIERYTDWRMSLTYARAMAELDRMSDEKLLETIEVKDDIGYPGYCAVLFRTGRHYPFGLILIWDTNEGKAWCKYTVMRPQDEGKKLQLTEVDHIPIRVRKFIKMAYFPEELVHPALETDNEVL